MYLSVHAYVKAIEWIQMVKEATGSFRSRLIDVRGVFID